MKLNIDAKKLELVAADLAKDVRGWFSEASVAIGEVDGKFYRLSVCKPDEDDDDWEVLPEYECITVVKEPT